MPTDDLEENKSSSLTEGTDDVQVVSGDGNTTGPERVWTEEEVESFMMSHLAEFQDAIKNIGTNNVTAESGTEGLKSIIKTFSGEEAPAIEFLDEEGEILSVENGTYTFRTQGKNLTQILGATASYFTGRDSHEIEDALTQYGSFIGMPTDEGTPLSPLENDQQNTQDGNFLQTLIENLFGGIDGASISNALGVDIIGIIKGFIQQIGDFLKNTFGMAASPTSQTQDPREELKANKNDLTANKTEDVVPSTENRYTLATPNTAG